MPTFNAGWLPLGEAAVAGQHTALAPRYTAHHNLGALCVTELEGEMLGRSGAGGGGVGWVGGWVIGATSWQS